MPRVLQATDEHLPFYVDSQVELLSILGLTYQSFKNLARESESPGRCEGQGLGAEDAILFRYNASRWVQYLIKRRVQTARYDHAAGYPDGEAPVKAPEQMSPVEQKRMLEVEHKKIDLAERRRDLIPLEHVQPFLDRLAVKIRAMSEALERKFGPQAKRLVNEMLDEMAHDVRVEFGQTEAKETELVDESN